MVDREKVRVRRRSKTPAAAAADRARVLPVQTSDVG